MLRMPAVPRLSWPSPFGGTGEGERRSPVEIVATMGTYLTRTHAAEVSGLRAGPFGRWADGVTAMRADCVAFAGHWRAHNEKVLQAPGPLWVVLGDSTAQGLGAPSPDGGYVGQVLDVLRHRTGRPWQVLNLSASGSLIHDVLNHQLPLLPASAELVTCGIGVNDILYTGPGKLFADLRALLEPFPITPSCSTCRCRPIRGPARPGQPALRGADQPHPPRGGRRPGTAGGRGVRPLPAAVDREVRVRLLPPQPGRLPRLDPGPAGRPLRTGSRRRKLWFPDQADGGSDGAGDRPGTGSPAHGAGRPDRRRAAGQEYGEDHLPGAINLPLRRIEAEAASVLDHPGNRRVLLGFGLRPQPTSRVPRTLGFSDVYDYRVGKQDWMGAGCPPGSQHGAPAPGRCGEAGRTYLLPR